jgi:N-acetylneuraminate synthase
VGEEASCFIVAEVGLTHDGSLGGAHAYIDAAAEVGVDAVKFQTHIAEAEATDEEGFRTNVFVQDATRADYWRRTGFTEVQWSGLREHAESRGLEFLSTPFSVPAVRLLRRIGVKAWKVGSGEANNPFLLEEIAEGREPVLLSTGMSYLSEIDESVRMLLENDVPLLVLQCTNRYPCPPEHLGFNMIAEYRSRYQTPVGFSDHSGETAPSLAAVALGAKALEVHVTWHKAAFGPDVKASLTFEQLAELVRGVRIIERALASAVDKDAQADNLETMRRLFNKSLVASTDIREGTIINREHLDAKKPCVGIPVSEYRTVVGRTTARDIKKDEHIKADDLR